MTGYDHGGTEAGDGAAAPAPGHPTTAHLTSQYGSTFFTWILVLSTIYKLPNISPSILPSPC